MTQNVTETETKSHSHQWFWHALFNINTDPKTKTQLLNCLNKIIKSNFFDTGVDMASEREKMIFNVEL